ncbi:hypothetical protein BCR32DRAFT_304069 [Anaeromyces robustus]|uniref:Karyogamy protein 5 n=1 Tax=Anaeromyces robustus TaxID=1754192 RepID=A0A1Y1WSD6_9FUNG|nr:hypothetical protein BCR32DRAFT_304069 [Anaeromyces robustus]|eukprot:ORX76208.1 hypothetical protein BCR32DRAFT_304069 [Anaeromyces robustus]
MNSKFMYLYLFCCFITSINGFSFFKKNKSNKENNFEPRQPIIDESKSEIKYNNLYLMSKRYEDFLSDNYGIQQENINHDVLTDFDIAINPSNIDVEYVNIYNRAINSFNKYTSKEDCFQNSIKTLKYGCLEMELDDNKKMEYAVELTLCELTSANISVPTECRHDQKNRSMAKCVENISRYSQLWTSYSGYFKDVVNMCYAIRYPLERNLLQNIHRNITKYQFNNMHVIASLYKREFLKIIELSEDYEVLLKYFYNKIIK